MCNSSRMKEKTPVHMLKREDISLEGRAARRHAGDLKEFSAPDYISGSKSNPHSEPAEIDQPHYKDHGAGNHHGEDGIMREDKIQKGKVYKNGPRHTGESTELEED